MSKITEILPNLEGLSSKELKIIRAEVDRLLYATHKIDTQLYQAIQWVLGVDLPLSKFEKTATYKQMCVRDSEFNEFIETLCKGIELKRGDNLKIRVFLIQLIKDYLIDIRVPISINSIVGQLNNIKVIFDKAYPGYWISGHAGVVAKKILER